MADNTKLETESITKSGRIDLKNIYGGVISQLLEEVKHLYQESGKLTDEILSALQCVFPSQLLPTLDLIDNKSVTLVTSPSGRQLYQVIGSSGTPYTCYTSCDYCSCPAFRFTVLKKEESSMCKHILAIKLSEAMGVCKQLEVSDKELASMIMQID